MDLKLEKRLLNNGFTTIVGIDEAGRGAWAGPLVAGTIIFPKPSKISTRLKRVVKDSKVLKPGIREEVFNELTSNFNWSVGVVEPGEIDKIGIGPANKLAMQKAVNNLKIDPDYLLVDYFNNIGIDVETHGIKKGDSNIWTIAAASIVAKVYRDNLMNEYHYRYRKWRFDLHKGYGTDLHLTRLKKHGITKLHRLSFKPISDLKS